MKTRMAERVGMEGSAAIAEAVRLANADVVAAYPITPQTHIVERLADLVANGELDAEFVPVESEHSAMSACLGSSAVGARTFTATAGQGLELMHEVLYVASAMRLPIVMVVANRALSGPLNVWGDHSDAMAVRDVGWLQMFAENGQQALDLTVCAFRMAEDQRVLFPAIVHIDGFHLSHVVEPLIPLKKEQVERFLPPYHHPYALDPQNPVTMGAFAAPNWYTESKQAQEAAFAAIRPVIAEIWKDFGDISGRYYNPVEGYRSEDAKVLLLTMGSFGETAMLAVDELRASGEEVGLIRLRLWRPFPFDELREAIRSAEVLIVLDRAISMGGPEGPVFSEVKAALYSQRKRPKMVSFIGGLGGRDISVEEFKLMIRKGIKRAKKRTGDETEIIGVRD